MSMPRYSDSSVYTSIMYVFCSALPDRKWLFGERTENHRDEYVYLIERSHQACALDRRRRYQGRKRIRGMQTVPYTVFTRFHVIFYIPVRKNACLRSEFSQVQLTQRLSQSRPVSHGDTENESTTIQTRKNYLVRLNRILLSSSPSWCQYRPTRVG